MRNMYEDCVITNNIVDHTTTISTRGYNDRLYKLLNSDQYAEICEQRRDVRMYAWSVIDANNSAALLTMLIDNGATTDEIYYSELSAAEDKDEDADEDSYDPAEDYSRASDYAEDEYTLNGIPYIDEYPPLDDMVPWECEDIGRWADDYGEPSMRDLYERAWRD